MNENNTNPRKPRRNPSARTGTPKKLYRKNIPESEKSVPAAESTVKAPPKSSTKKTESKESSKSKRPAKDKETRKTPVRIIPLGGLNEIGKNMTVFECSNDIFILDCGLAFPDVDMPGVDIVIPDFTYVERNIDKLRGIVITHGHEDHIGGLAYLLKRLDKKVDIYATKLTMGLIEGKFKEADVSNANMHVLKPRQTAKMGCMGVEFVKVNHSIPDAVGMVIHTPAGIIIHTGDFKVDFSPIDGEIIDLAYFAEVATKKGVLALMADSTNAERPGYTHSEKTVGESFDRLFRQGEGKRIIIATFSSNIHRVQQIINSAVKYKRKVAVLGRSMVNVINTAIELGYLQAPDNLIIDIEMMPMYENRRIVLITTGSQGEPMSALTRMAMNDHRNVSITSNDFIIISATPIPGNEKYVTRVVNELMKLGAEVVYEAMYEVHVSGHACQEELKLIQAITKPKFFIPVHGEYKHLKKHADIAMQMGMDKDHIIIAENGNVIETDSVSMRVVSQVPSGRILVDGLGVGDVGSIVLRDRNHLSQDGIIVVVIGIERATNHVVSGPDIISRGFVYVRESEELMGGAKIRLTETLRGCSYSEMKEWTTLKGKLRDALSDYIYQKTKRSPMILPIIMET